MRIVKLATCVFTTLLLIGIVFKLRKRCYAAICYFAILIVFAGAYLDLLDIDARPFTGQLGQTWRLFKLTQWVYPYLVLGK